MVDLDPEIWENKTLGEAANLDTLDVRTAQEVEDRAARIEGREPLRVVRIHNYPGAERDNVITSSYDDGLRKVDPNTGEPGPGEWGQNPVDGEPEEPGYEKETEEENAEESEFSGTETNVGSDTSGTES